MKKKATIFALIFNIFFNASANAVIVGSGQKRISIKGSVRKVVTKGTKIQIHPETTFNSEINLEGDYFSAFISEEDAIKLQVPFGSKLIGTITKIKAAKSLNRDAQLGVHVTELMLPDGDTVEVDANFVSSDIKSIGTKVKIVAKESSKVTASALVGASDAFRYGGLSAAMATNGLSVAAGAGLGLGLGLIGAATQKGDISASGFGTNTLKLKDDFVFLEELPVMTQSLKPFTPETFGIKLEVKDISKMFSKEYGDFLLFDVDIENKSAKKLFLGDFVLTSKKHIIPVLNNPLITNTQSFKSIRVNEKDSCRLAFSLAKVKENENYKLRLLDPISDKVIVDFDVDIASFI